MGPLAQLTLACGQTLPLMTLRLWLGRGDILAERSVQPSFLAVTLLLILVPMSQ